MLNTWLGCISENSKAYVFVQNEEIAEIFKRIRPSTQVYTGHKERDVKDLEVKYNGNVPTEIPDCTYAANDECKTLDIEGKIRRIGKSAFMDCKQLKSAVIHDGVEIIDSKAFAGCKDLEEVVLPSTLKEMGSGVFQGCLQLKRVFIPSGVETINSECFYGCKSLEEIIIPESVKEINENAFAYCEKLERITFPTILKRIGRRAFANCESIIQLDITSKMKTLEATAFEGCTSLLQVESRQKLPEGFEKAFPEGSIVVKEIGKKQTRTYEILDGKIVSDSSEKVEAKPKDITIKEGNRLQTDYLAIVEKPGLLTRIRNLVQGRNSKKGKLDDIRKSTQRHGRDRGF